MFFSKCSTLDASRSSRRESDSAVRAAVVLRLARVRARTSSRDSSERLDRGGDERSGKVIGVGASAPREGEGDEGAPPREIAGDTGVGASEGTRGEWSDGTAGEGAPCQDGQK